MGLRVFRAYSGEADVFFLMTCTKVETIARLFQHSRKLILDTGAVAGFFINWKVTIRQADFLNIVGNDMQFSF